VRRSKALKPATVLAVNGLPRKFSAGQQRIPEAKPQNPPPLQVLIALRRSLTQTSESRLKENLVRAIAALEQAGRQ
jgi:hypothetical protein